MQVQIGFTSYVSPGHLTNIRMDDATKGMDAHKNHGRYLPHLESLMLSQILPIIGSLIASQIRAPINISIINSG